MRKIVAFLLATLLLAVGAVASAEAALNAGVSTAFSTIQTDGLALIDLAWPVVIAVTVAFIMIRLFKKAAAKAT
jgi:hypothetical protein